MPKAFESLFIELGLSATETKIYLSALKLGPTSVQEIAKQAKLSRTAAYDAVSSLQERGLIATFERGKRRFFSAAEPERALAYFRENVGRMKEKLDTLNRSITEIKMMAGGERPTVRLYEGDEALYALFNDMASVGPKEFLEVSNVDEVYKHLDTKYLHEVRKVLDPSRVKIRLLHRGETRAPREGTNYCRLPDKYGDFHGDLWIYDNRLAFTQFVGKTVVIIIESKAFADLARVMFRAAENVCAPPRDA
jgi:sugar-specific transcriptional regulator TrmB